MPVPLGGVGSKILACISVVLLFESQVYGLALVIVHDKSQSLLDQLERLICLQEVVLHNLYNVSNFYQARRQRIQKTSEHLKWHLILIISNQCEEYVHELHLQSSHCTTVNLVQTKTLYAMFHQSLRSEFNRHFLGYTSCNRHSSYSSGLSTSNYFVIFSETCFILKIPHHVCQVNLHNWCFIHFHFILHLVIFDILRHPITLDIFKFSSFFISVTLSSFLFSRYLRRDSIRSRGITISFSRIAILRVLSLSFFLSLSANLSRSLRSSSLSLEPINTDNFGGQNSYRIFCQLTILYYINYITNQYVGLATLSNESEIAEELDMDELRQSLASLKARKVDYYKEAAKLAKGKNVTYVKTLKLFEVKNRFSFSYYLLVLYPHVMSMFY
ncbi:hypothetical protein AGLY_014149 [Aphis glycines]|uniref:Uncharacterized protein n=1 Tax=Aphis glycines TaxID=307491 RepID=A0A6G0T6C1_APHGL|nr:hypothetical protein AGLY_014149 [Aphis glycines]